MSGTDSSPPPSETAELKQRIEAERTGQPRLIYRDRDDRQRILFLEDVGSRLSIGRGDESELALPWDAEVSLLHAELEHVGAAWLLVDDGLSSNGSFVNGERVVGRRRLRPGDNVRVGQTTLTFEAPGQAQAQMTSLPSTPQPTITAAQRRVLVALCRPFRDGGPHATPATNKQIADELVLSVIAVKTHLRSLFEKFEVGDLPQNKKRAAVVERAFRSGTISLKDL